MGFIIFAILWGLLVLPNGINLFDINALIQAGEAPAGQ